MLQVDPRRLLVTGASGKLGGRVVEKLLDNGVDVIAGSRDPSRLKGLNARGAELRHVDFDDHASLENAFAGVDSVLIVSTVDTPHDPGLRLRQHRAAVGAAVTAGVRHITYTSMQAPGASSPVPLAADHQGTEAAIQKTDLPYTILRANWYAELAFAFVPSMLQQRAWLSAAGDGRTAYVWRDDLAEACAASLLDGGDGKRTLDISGSLALSPREIVELVNEIFDAEVKLRLVDRDALTAVLASAGLPAHQVELLAGLDEHNRQGRADTGPEDFIALTGRRPRSFRDFLLANRDALLGGTRTG